MFDEGKVKIKKVDEESATLSYAAKSFVELPHIDHPVERRKRIETLVAHLIEKAKETEKKEVKFWNVQRLKNHRMLEKRLIEEVDFRIKSRFFERETLSISIQKSVQKQQGAIKVENKNGECSRSASSTPIKKSPTAKVRPKICQNFEIFSAESASCGKKALPEVAHHGVELRRCD